jgi:Pyridoxamine 5'-phosphate oxidase
MTNLRLVSPNAEPLGPEEREALLQRPDVLLSIARLNADGSPHVVPMWFLWRDERFHMTCRRAGRVKIRNIERDGRAFFAIFNTTIPYVAVCGPGVARVTTQDYDEVSAQIRLKYLGEERAGAWSRAVSGGRDGDGVIITLQPGRLLAWKIP